MRTPVQPFSTATTAQPGLSNATGEYNCFLNAIIQCLWQCPGFRNGLLDGNLTLKGDVAEGELGALVRI